MTRSSGGCLQARESQLHGTRSAKLQEVLRLQGGEVWPGTPAEFAAFIASETARLKKLMEATGVRIE